MKKVRKIYDKACKEKTAEHKRLWTKAESCWLKYLLRTKDLNKDIGNALI